MAWEEGEPQSGTKILLQSSHFSICLTKPHLYLSSLPTFYLSDQTTFVFVFSSHFCICLTKPSFYLSAQIKFVFVCPNHICICLLIPHLYLCQQNIFVFISSLEFAFGDFFYPCILFFSASIACPYTVLANVSLKTNFTGDVWLCKVQPIVII